MAFSSNRGGNLDLWAVNRENGAVRRLTDDAADDWDVVVLARRPSAPVGFEPDGPVRDLGGEAGWQRGRQQLSHDGAFAQNPQETADGAWVVYMFDESCTRRALAHAGRRQRPGRASWTPC